LHFLELLQPSLYLSRVIVSNQQPYDSAPVGCDTAGWHSVTDWIFSILLGLRHETTFFESSGACPHIYSRLVKL
jgi:hypothetical protein